MRPRFCLLPLALALCGALRAQPSCAPTPLYSLCDLVFELSEQEAAAHPNPYLSVELQAEFRSPRHRTFLLPAYWDGGRRVVIRFTPLDPGEWDFRVTSNIARLEGMQGKLTATPSDTPGFIRPRNVHHWAYTESGAPHLWMGDTSYRFAFLNEELFRAIVDKRAEQKFNHIRGLVIGGETEASQAFPAPDRPDPEHFRRVDGRIRYMNSKGIIADLVLAGDENHLVKLFPAREQRERYVRYLVARYAAMNVTWQGVQEFEEYESGRELLREIGQLLAKLDPYQHPRSTHTVATSAPLLSDGWMNYVVYQSSDNALGAIEHQLYAIPFVNAEFAYEDSGAGKSLAHHVDADEFRRRLWNATMNGQYPTFGNTGLYGGRKFEVDAKYVDSPGARQMTVWHDFFSRTRYWELEPYFDVDGGRALALEIPHDEEIEGIEYVVYMEKPGPVEILVQKHSYDVAWFNPVTGEYVKQKGFKADRYSGEPPDRSHDWVLHISREGKKESMLRSYKFESRPILMQEVEQSPPKIPFEIVEPAAQELAVSQPAKYAVKITRDTRATRSMLFLWTGEVVADGQGYRVLGTGREGAFRVRPGMARNFPAVLHLRLLGLNANGKLYSLDRIYKLTQ